MSRPTQVTIDARALMHNVAHVKRLAPGRKIIAMVKANAYGCGLSSVVPILEDQVDAFGVACLEEALAIRHLGSRRDCVLFQGIFSADELSLVAQHHFQCVLHQPQQLKWLLAQPLLQKIKVWVKVNTGMQRLGFDSQEVYEVLAALKNCSWVDPDIGLMTHLASADEPDHYSNQKQLDLYHALHTPEMALCHSIANSAAILALPETHANVVRPGIMLYGVSPFAQQTGLELGLQPVMSFISALSAIHHCPAGVKVGYNGSWQTKRPSLIGIVAAGYGDGYPRHISENTPVWIKGSQVPIVGRVSMDMLTVDLTDVTLAPEIGDAVELWGSNIAVERIAQSAGTIAYELLCQYSPRVRSNNYLCQQA